MPLVIAIMLLLIIQLARSWVNGIDATKDLTPNEIKEIRDSF